MSHIRFGALAALALAFMLAACSTDNDLAATPNLEPQFGTADEDIGVDVAFSSTGRIYSLSMQYGPTYDEDGYESGYYENAVLRRFDNNGNLIWTRSVVETGSNYYGDIEFGSFDVKSLKTDTQGYSYVLSGYGITQGDCLPVYETQLSKIDASGNVVRTYNVGLTGGSNEFAYDYNSNAVMAVDNSGNMYVGAENGNVDTYECRTTGKTLTISKIAPSGTLQWQRTSTVGAPTSITVTGAGNVYVIGSKGMARYSSTGNLMWTKTGTNYAVGQYSKIVASVTNLYTRNVNTIRKYDANGKLLWSKVQSGLNTLVIGDISADANGNVYISGKYRPSTSSPANAFVRKLRPTGAILWTKTFGTPQYDDGRGIATINGSEIYVTGETQGSLAHTNIGGKDGYLRKLNSLGNQVWIR